MDLVLTLQEKQTPLAIKVSKHLVASLQELRVRNDKAMSQEDRNTLIAQIKEVKALMRAFADEPTVKSVMPELA